LLPRKPYANNPEKLANLVYANRMGNGGPETGDGYRNRGGGLTHHTGAAEYARVKKRTGHGPDTVRTPANAVAMVEAACSYWVDRNVIEAAERGDVQTVTRRINGGLIGYQDRLLLHRRYVAAIDGKPIPKEATRVETAKRQAQQAVAAGSGSGGSATTGVATVSVPKPAPSPTAATNHNGLIIGVVCVVAAVGLAIVAHRLWKKSQATKLVLEKERQQIFELRSEAAKEFPILNAGA
jgi:predicted chitinase